MAAAHAHGAVSTATYNMIVIVVIAGWLVATVGALIVFYAISAAVAHIVSSSISAAHSHASRVDMFMDMFIVFHIVA
jgi:hypothetical protein